MSIHPSLGKLGTNEKLLTFRLIGTKKICHYVARRESSTQLLSFFYKKQALPRR